jgi:TonB family protein
MPKTINEHDQYFLDILKISLMISLGILILVFYIFPKFTGITEVSRQKINIKLFVSDIPQTRQLHTSRMPPPKPTGVIPIVGDEDEFPEEISVQRDLGISAGDPLAAGIPPEIAAKPLLEVYPNVSGVTCKGYVKLLLLVNKVGRAEIIEVLENSTRAEQCKKLAIEAAKKSRWIPAKVNEKSVDSWVTKTYKFNIKK